MELNYKLLDKLQDDAKGLLEQCGVDEVVFEMDKFNDNHISILCYGFATKDSVIMHLIDGIVDVYETFLNMDEVKYIQ